MGAAIIHLYSQGKKEKAGSFSKSEKRSHMSDLFY